MKAAITYLLAAILMLYCFVPEKLAAGEPPSKNSQQRDRPSQENAPRNNDLENTPGSARGIPSNATTVFFHKNVGRWYYIISDPNNPVVAVQPFDLLHRRLFDTWTRSLTDIPEGFVFYGPTGRITYVDEFLKVIGKDSIPFADSIPYMAFRTTGEAYALADNAGATYLAAKSKNKWSAGPIPVYIQLKPEDNKVNLLTWLLSALFIVVISAVFFFAAALPLKNRIKQYDILRREKENPIFTKADIPLSKYDKDLLGFTNVEDALIDVIRNPSTALPLSIVISGKWGSGKSSIMNRIRQKLETDPETKGRFLTTWFNAWHLQGEKSLLDTFLISIVKFYEKSSFHLYAFRFRLFRNRLIKLPFIKQFLFWVATSIIILTISIIVYNILGFESSDFLKRCGNRIPSLLGEAMKEGSVGSIMFKVLMFALSVVSLFFLRKELAPAGLNTFMELLNIARFKAEADSQSVGHKEKFKEDFWEIIKASDSTKKVVIFVDDIDRINGGKILELLEAINFISDIASAPSGMKNNANLSKSVSSNMIFVLAMATGEVARNLGTELSAISRQQELSPLELQALGLNYIEKMVQLVVSVPFDERHHELGQLLDR